MKLHEYQAKRQMEKFNLPVLKGAVITDLRSTVDVVTSVGRALGSSRPKSTRGAGGKAGGVLVVRDVKGAEPFVAGILGKPLVTAQTGPEGLRVRTILVEPAVTVERELYAAVVMNRTTGKPVLIVSAEGGVDIETVAAASPEKIVRVHVDPTRGLQASRPGRGVRHGTGRRPFGRIRAVFSKPCSPVPVDRRQFGGSESLGRPCGEEGGTVVGPGRQNDGGR